MKAAPPVAANVPYTEIPPEVPRSTGFQDVINRGLLGLSTPSSVAHVSALTAARDPANPNHIQPLSGKKKCKLAKMAASPPLASTWPISLNSTFFKLLVQNRFLLAEESCQCAGGNKETQQEYRPLPSAQAKDQSSGQ